MSNGTSRETVLAGFVNAQEFYNLCEGYNIDPVSSPRSQVEAFVTRFYQLCLSRDPDSGGLSAWTDQLINQTKTGADVANGFVFSTEFINRNVDNATYLTILYRAFFYREPDTAGYNEWYSQLGRGTSRQTVLNGFLGAQEFYNLCSQYGITPQ